MGIEGHKVKMNSYIPEFLLNLNTPSAPQENLQAQ
jgi:hypothetical protein